MRLLRRGSLFIPDRTIIAAPTMLMEGIATVERFRGDHRNGICTGRWKFRNLITNAGLDLVKPADGATITSGALVYMAVGTDSTAPAATQTGLGAEIAPSSSNRTNSNGAIADVNGFGPSSEYSYLKRTRLFTETQGNGNLTELGWFTAVSAGTMFSRMLFKDDVGTPTTIVKTSADQLRVTYEIRMYRPMTDVTGVITLNAVNYDYIVRAAQAGNASSWGFNGGGSLGTLLLSTGNPRAYDGTIGAATSIPSGAVANADSSVWAAYTNGNYYRDLTDKYEPGTANYAGGIGAVTAVNASGPAPLFQVGFTPKIPKLNTQRLQFTWRFSWGRYP